MTQGWRASAKQNRRERYLSSAAHLFAERGFHGVSIDDLGAAAGVSGPALYRHFAGKEAILVELLTDSSERLLAGGRRIVADLAGHEALTELIDFHVDFALAERDVIRIQDHELSHLPAAANRQVRSLQRQYVQLWVEVLTQLHPGVDPQLRRAQALAVFGLLNSTPFSARRTGSGRGAVEPTRRLLAQMALACLVDVVPGAPSAARQGWREAGTGRRDDPGSAAERGADHVEELPGGGPGRIPAPPGQLQP